MFIKIDYLRGGSKCKVATIIEQVASDTFETVLESMSKNIAGVLLDDSGFLPNEITELRERLAYEQQIINLSYNINQTCTQSLRGFSCKEKHNESCQKA